VSVVFPQFVTCNSSATGKEVSNPKFGFFNFFAALRSKIEKLLFKLFSTDQIVSYAASAGGRIIGAFGDSSVTAQNAQLLWATVARRGYGVLVEVKPGPYYYIARKETE
jgi:hypothetical protein